MNKYQKEESRKIKKMMRDNDFKKSYRATRRSYRDFRRSMDRIKKAAYKEGSAVFYGL